MTPLSEGARIAVVAPSGAVPAERLARGLAVLEGWGYRPDVLPGVGEKHRYLAGADAVRARDLDRALFGGDYDAVWMARGGYGLARILGRLDWERLRPIPVFGFSDATALLNQLPDRGGIAVHAPVVTSLGDVADAASLEHLRALLAGEGVAPLAGRALRGGRAEGRLVGGNLCVLASLCGTRWQLRGSGAIVLLEDVGEVPYKVDRLLHQCVEAGCFDDAAGFALGTFLGADGPADGAWSVLDVVMDALAPFGVPVLAELPVGHGAQNHAVPFERARIAGDTLELGDDVTPGEGFPAVELV